MQSIGAVLDAPTSEDEQRNMIQALIFLAATLGNAMSDNSVDFSKAHVHESAEQIRAVLNDTFSIEV